MTQTEDVPYNVSEFATPDEKTEVDDDLAYKGVLIDIQEYLDTAIDKHNTFDVIDPSAEKIMTTQQQVLVHKEVVVHLRSIKTIVDNKLKEIE